jgi:hypothetical protein
VTRAFSFDNTTSSSGVSGAGGMKAMALVEALKLVGATLLEGAGRFVVDASALVSGRVWADKGASSEWTRQRRARHR